MRCQLLDPFIEAGDILEHRFDLGLDDTGGLMHPRITQDRPHRMKDQHQIVRPGHIDTPATAFLDKLWKLQVDLGIDRFRGQEHDRAVRRLARDDVALGDIGDMFPYIILHHPPRRRPFGVGSGGAKRAVGFKRKFGIDADRARRCRHVEKTVDATAIAKRVLKAEGALGKRVTNQVFKLHLAKTAACLLVRQNILQLANLPGKCRDMGVRLLDNGKLLGHAGKRAVGAVILVTKRIFQAGPEAPLGFLHLRGDRAVKLAGLRGKLGQLSLQLGEGLAILPGRPLAHQHEDKTGDDEKREEGDQCVERHGQEFHCGNLLGSGPRREINTGRGPVTLA